MTPNTNTQEHDYFIGGDAQSFTASRTFERPSRADRRGCRGTCRRGGFLVGRLRILDRGLKWSQDHDIEAAILGASRRRVIAGNRVELAITRGGQVTRGQFKLRDQQAYHFRGSRSRKFPVGRKMQVVNGNVVGVALNAKIFLPLFENFR